ncbi:hypothetical protein [Methylobacter sp. S3L5C]|uniref:hypothetical protein n=1 Tax=Methylobacter sp. S3L5C TaxID=2839024 RepID=UPI001FAE12C4|nr:hypothetical protein [Methylobacter sp. S3L5C]UOA08462.1 hypothetical protein KKZ03_20085 [Methylobacter sp. S3L5C]
MSVNEGEQLRTAVDIAAKFNFAVYQVINEIKKIGFNVGRNEILDDNLIERVVTIFEDKNNTVEQMVIDRQKKIIDRQKKAIADQEELNKLIDSLDLIELEEISNEPKKEKIDFFTYALENFDKALLKLENVSEKLADSLYKSNKFNFDNIYLIAQKEESEKTGVFEYSLYCMQSEDNEIYTSIWDNNESLFVWKAANFIQDEYCRIEFNEFYLMFILQNKGNIKNIFLNTSPEINDFSSAINAAIDKLELFSAIGCWPAIKYFLLQKGISDVIIELIESYIVDNTLSKNQIKQRCINKSGKGNTSPMSGQIL